MNIFKTETRHHRLLDTVRCYVNCGKTTITVVKGFETTVYRDLRRLG